MPTKQQQGRRNLCPCCGEARLGSLDILRAAIGARQGELVAERKEWRDDRFLNALQQLYYWRTGQAG